jgi:hypothetical protein
MTFLRGLKSGPARKRNAIEHRPARTWSEACVAARQLLDLVEQGQWHRGEIVLVEVRQSDE